MTTKDEVIRVHGEHPDWTAKQIAEHLGIERYHVYNHARAEGLTLAAAPVMAPFSGGRTLPAVIDARVEQPPDFTVMASSPREMEKAQHELLAWVGQKIEAERAIVDDVEAQRSIAMEAGWATDGWDRQRRIAIQRVEYYRKIKAALEAGYYIVPPFPLDIFAIRTDRSKPDPKMGTWAHDNRVQRPRMLPIGEGDYVSDVPTLSSDTYGTGKIEAGKEVMKTDYWAEDFRNVDFPFKLAKPAIMKATMAAMALKIFDQMGCLPARRGNADPVICGQMLQPGKSRWAPPLTFFVTWWLDTEML